MVALMQEQEQIIERMALLKKAGVTDGYQEYDELSARLAEINKEVHTIRNGFSELESKGRKALDSCGTSAKKSWGAVIYNGKPPEGNSAEFIYI